MTEPSSTLIYIGENLVFRWLSMYGRHHNMQWPFIGLDCNQLDYANILLHVYHCLFMNVRRRSGIIVVPMSVTLFTIRYKD